METVNPKNAEKTIDINNQLFKLATPKQRLLAALIDNAIFIFAYLPYIGWLFWIGGIAYLLTKDALPFLAGQSVGKKVMKIRVLDAETGEKITDKYEKSIIRSAALFTVVDAFMVLTEDRKRFGDQWAKTIVVQEEIK